ncbi:AhpC/TSA family protein [Pseudoflavitalea sp. X16]|uniref:TlpA disulfide reductase family protein n=1 Tax=Paraflavitalea devenefica TaxID=2716334 RepID=UPI001423B5EC|nr:TlpA disulfide reductase family protein [Paraflavitalea devenefica]NII28487.1 AhpC/TSA family protein [Paraflavitalea devenefica]
MPKIHYILAAAVITLCSAASPIRPGSWGHEPGQGFTINGHIEGLSSGTVYLVHEYDQTTFTDSAAVTNGRFVINGRLPEPLVCTLKVSGTNQIRIFFVENAQLSVTGSLRSLHNVVITGSRENDVWNGFKDNGQEVIGEKIMEVRQAARNRNNLADSQRATLSPADHVIIDVFKDSVMQSFVTSHTTSVAAAFIIYNTYVVYPDSARASRLYDLLSEEVKHSYYGRRIRQYLEAPVVTAIGQKAPGFSLPDTAGNMISLAGIKGKYILIDFWASWCGPCRKEHPFLIAAHNRFHAKGFDILSISVDESREAWLTAIHKDGLLWQQVSDGKGMGGIVPGMYGVKSIPKNFLLDKTGTIIARNLRGEELAKKLEMLLP